MSLTSLFVLTDRKRDFLLFFLIGGFPCKLIFFYLDVALFAPVVIWAHGNAFVDD